MIIEQIFILTISVLALIHTNEGQEIQPTELTPNLVLKNLQPPPLTIPGDVGNQSSVREKRCGGGGCCGGGCQSRPAPSKVINIQIQVQKQPARHPPPRMVHRPAPRPVALVPIAVIPVAYVSHPAPMCCPAPRPAPVCCGGGGGGGGYGGGGGKWKGK